MFAPNCVSWLTSLHVEVQSTFKREVTRSMSSFKIFINKRLSFYVFILKLVPRNNSPRAGWPRAGRPCLHLCTCPVIKKVCRPRRDPSHKWRHYGGAVANVHQVKFKLRSAMQRCITTMSNSIITSITAGSMHGNFACMIPQHFRRMGNRGHAGVA